MGKHPMFVNGEDYYDGKISQINLQSQCNPY